MHDYSVVVILIHRDCSCSSNDVFKNLIPVIFERSSIIGSFDKKCRNFEVTFLTDTCQTLKTLIRNNHFWCWNSNSESQSYTYSGWNLDHQNFSFPRLMIWLLLNSEYRTVDENRRKRKIRLKQMTHIFWGLIQGLEEILYWLLLLFKAPFW